MILYREVTIVASLKIEEEIASCIKYQILFFFTGEFQFENIGCQILAVIKRYTVYNISCIRLCSGKQSIIMRLAYYSIYWTIVCITPSLTLKVRGSYSFVQFMFIVCCFLLQSTDEVRLATDKGVAGFVATRGELLNIKDAYSHNLFYKGFDEVTGFKTRLVI